jgi:hypothetical protein
LNNLIDITQIEEFNDTVTRLSEELTLQIKKKNIPFKKLEKVVSYLNELNLKEKACKLFLEHKSEMIEDEILNIYTTGSILVNFYFF